MTIESPDQLPLALRPPPDPDRPRWRPSAIERQRGLRRVRELRRRLTDRDEPQTAV